MHRCFLVPDIVDLICRQIKADSPSVWLNTLAYVARTCKVLHEPALNYLWRELGSLVPLVRCMPEDLWTWQEGGFGRLEFVRPIVPSDWTRFRQYARRVKRFGLGFGRGKLTTEAYQVLSMAAGDQPLLPNIQELFWSFASVEFPYIHLLLGSNITTFTLRNPDNILPIATLSLVASMNTRYPRLTHLTLMGFGEAPCAAAISSTVCGWHHLRHLNAGALSNDALRHIAALPSLTLLQLRYNVIDNPHLEYPLPQNSCAFPAIQRLIIASPDFSFGTDLLRSMSPCSPLKCVAFATRKHLPSTSMQWKNVIQAVHDICDHSTLEQLTLGDNDEVLDQAMHAEYPNVVGADDLKLLLTFPRLTSFNLHAFGGFNLDDAMLKDMAVAWPRLTNLRISSRFAPPPRATISALASLAHHCPDLRVLKMAFHATDSSIPVPTSSPSFPNRELINLDVENSPISHAPSVAAFLSDIFPEISTIVANEDDNVDEETESEKAWSEVMSLLWVFVSVRDHENTRRLRMLQ